MPRRTTTIRTLAHHKALARVMTPVLKDDTELFKQFSDNDSFKEVAL
jgi:hypothetical protein